MNQTTVTNVIRTIIRCSLYGGVVFAITTIIVVYITRACKGDAIWLRLLPYCPALWCKHIFGTGDANQPLDVTLTFCTLVNATIGSIVFGITSCIRHSTKCAYYESSN